MNSLSGSSPHRKSVTDACSCRAASAASTADSYPPRSARSQRIRMTAVHGPGGRFPLPVRSAGRSVRSCAPRRAHGLDDRVDIRWNGRARLLTPHIRRQFDVQGQKGAQDQARVCARLAPLHLIDPPPADTDPFGQYSLIQPKRVPAILDQGTDIGRCSQYVFGHVSNRLLIPHPPPRTAVPVRSPGRHAIPGRRGTAPLRSAPSSAVRPPGAPSGR